MTSKGQITIPKEVRDDFGLKPGDELEVGRADGVITVKKYFDEAKFNAAIEEYAGTVDLGGMTVDEYIDDIRGH
jgi:AbrB family looped-hinge helix DNA binding protein